MVKEAGPNMTVLSIMPIFHGFGLGVCIHTPLYLGMKCVLIPAFSFKEFANLIKRYRPNFIVGVPALFESLIKNKFNENELSCIKCIISGGDSMTSELKKKVDVLNFDQLKDNPELLHEILKDGIKIYG